MCVVCATAGVSTPADGCRWITSAKDLDVVFFFSFMRQARFLQAEQIQGPDISCRVKFVRLVCDSGKKTFSPFSQKADFCN